MNFLNRAMKSMIRVKSRTGLISFIFFVISFLILVGISVLYASENAVARAKSQMNPIVIVKPAQKENSYLDSRNHNLLVSEKLERIIPDERILAWNQNVEMNQKSVNFDSWTVMEEKIGSTSLYYEMNVLLSGNKTADLIEFHNGSYELTEGRFYNQEELKYHDAVCVIDEKLAEANGLTVGDTIITQSFTNSADENAEFRYLYNSWKVIGLYRHGVDNNPQFSESRPVIYDQELQENTILVPGTTLAEIRAACVNRTEMILSEREKSEPIHWEEADQYNSDIVILLDNPEHLEAFIEECSAISDGIYTLESNNALYEKYGKPLNVIRFFALIILAVAVGNGILLILILTALQIQNRKKEIGSFLSVGVPRYKIVIQFFVEMALEMLAGTCVAAIAAFGVVKPLNDQLLTLTIIQKQTEFLDADKVFSYSESEKYLGEVDPEEIVDQFQVQLTGKEIAACLICESGILLVSLCLASSKILKMKPKEILT